MNQILKIGIFLLIQVFTVTSCNSQKRTKMNGQSQTLHNRQPVVAGSFYPSDPSDLSTMLKGFFDKAPVAEHSGTVVALISPHAGYVFSGQVAAASYKQLDRTRHFDHVFLIGPSHYVHLNGASIYNIGNYETPLGEVKVDTVLASRLIEDHSFFEYYPAVHSQEHSLEVQLPFLQYWLKEDFQVVPIVIGSQDPAMAKKIAKALKPYFKPENLFVISTDLSHYPTYDHARIADEHTLEAVVSGEPKRLLHALRKNEERGYPNLLTSMCGWPGVLTLLDITEGRKDIHYHKVLYMNSGDTHYGDHSRVVGYGSVMVTQETAGEPDPKEYLSREDKMNLLRIARRTLEEKIKHHRLPDIDTTGFSKTLLKPAGAFVTLHTHAGQLRGCIGRFRPNEPLCLVVRDMAVAAALQDNRFPPVMPDEVDDLDIEISVLTPLKRIHSIDEFKLGRDGIYMIKNGRSGTFLPQVADNTHWTREEFLGHCARDKAGIGWDGWKDAELYTYQAIVFSEKEMMKK